MDASGADKLILLVQTNPVLYTTNLKKGDIWQIGVDIGVNSERTIDLGRCRFSFLVSRWRCDRSVRFLVSRFSFLVSRFSFLVSRFSFLVPRFSFLGGGVTGPLRCTYRKQLSSQRHSNQRSNGSLEDFHHLLRPILRMN